MTDTAQSRSNGVDQHEITVLLQAHREGDRQAFDRLVELVYPHLRRLARSQLRRGRAGETLRTTALVHEAYLRLADETGIQWDGRAHFFGVAARAMRQIIVDHARARNAAKRGGGKAPLTLDESDLAVEEQAETILLLDTALDKLADLNERLSRVVECRFFAGLTEEETAAALSLSRATVQRDWTKARAWLRRELDTA
jgi:RNA polymerase sigma factor (TIGR02999 family)